MGLEATTYITGLTASWPPSSDPKSQGDDHIRLLKSVLQSTFPTASGPFYSPKTEATSALLTLDVTDQNNVVMVTTTAGDVAVTLPAGFTTTNAGWSCEVVKVSSDVNAAVVSPASGTISSKAGVTATIRVGAFCEPARFLWTGTIWICVKPGVAVGTSFNWDGATVPYGCLTLDGSAYNTTTYAELYSAFGSATLRDKRGRAEIGSGTGSGLTARVLGTAYGAETKALATANLPAQTPSGSIALSVTGSASFSVRNYSSSGASVPAQVSLASNVGTDAGSFNTTFTNPTYSFTGTAFAGQIATPIDLLQPSIGTQKLIRAC